MPTHVLFTLLLSIVTFGSGITASLFSRNNHQSSKKSRGGSTTTNKPWLYHSLQHSKTQAFSICLQRFDFRSTHTYSPTPLLRLHIYYPNTAATTPGSHHPSPAPVLSYATRHCLSTTRPTHLLTTCAPPSTMA